MGVNELKKLQEEIIRKNKNCNLIGAILLSIIILITLSFILRLRRPPMFVIVSIGIELSIGVGIITIIKGFVNGKDIKTFNKEFKDIFVLNALKKTFDDITYNMEKGFDEKEIYEYGMLNTSDRYNSNDYIKGTYKNIKFEQSDIKIEEEHEHEDSDGNKTTTWVTIFEGRYMIFDFNKKFIANMQVTSSNFTAQRRHSRKEFSKVDLEDMEFNKMFDVYTDVEHDAFYILTPHFMQKIKELYKSLDSPIMLCFIDNRLHIALDNREDSFEWNVLKPINEEEINNNIIKDIKLITDFVNELNLDNDLFRRDK